MTAETTVVLDRARLRRCGVFGGLAVLILLATLDWLAWSHPAWPGPLRRLCNASREDGLASWAATVVAAMTAIVAWLWWAMVRHLGARRRRIVGWAVAAIVLSWIAVDDGARVHERLGTMHDQARRARETGGYDGRTGPAYPSYGWQVVVGPPLAVAGVLAWGVLFVEVSRARRWWLVMAGGAIATAIAMDFVDGLERDHPWNLLDAAARTDGLDDWSHRRLGVSAFATIQHGARALEELIELGAAIVILLVLVDGLLALVPVVRVVSRDAFDVPDPLG